MKRLESLDALRGFDMLMIMGFGKLMIALCALFGCEDCILARQFQHVEWNGLHFEDMIFPLFLFLAGVSWPFSYARQKERATPTRSVVFRCVRRAIILCLLGLAYNGLLEGQLRVGAVLARIGIAWMVGALLYMFCRARTLVVLTLLIPVAYWILLYFFPAPDALRVVIPDELEYVREFGTGPFSVVGNLSGWVDRTFMPGILIPYTGIADNQSSLGVVPAVGTALFGILFGEFLRTTGTTMSAGRRIGLMLLAAGALVVLGLAVANCFGSMSMPVNKKLWSASFTFIVGGCSVAMLAAFHWLFDLHSLPRLSFFFKVIGMNSITIYLAQRFVPFGMIVNGFLGNVAKSVPIAGGDPVLRPAYGLVSLMPTELGSFVLAFAYVALCWVLLFFLYRKQVFLKV